MREEDKRRNPTCSSLSLPPHRFPLSSLSTSDSCRGLQRLSYSSPTAFPRPASPLDARALKHVETDEELESLAAAAENQPSESKSSYR